MRSLIIGMLLACSSLQAFGLGKEIVSGEVFYLNEKAADLELKVYETEGDTVKVWFRMTNLVRESKYLFDIFHGNTFDETLLFSTEDGFPTGSIKVKVSKKGVEELRFLRIPIKLWQNSDSFLMSMTYETPYKIRDK